MANPFIHVELNTTDVDKAKEFYGRLFDWKLEDTEIPRVGHYTLINRGEGTGGGIMKQMIPGASSFWLAYVEVDDITAATKKAQSLGAKVMAEVKEIADMGWLSIIVDPTGAMLGLWKTKAGADQR
jgi:predicted enzyme related to lactoylglutathione lyase